MMFYTPKQVADLLQLTEMTIYRMIKRRDIAYYSIGRTLRISSVDLEAYLAGCKQEIAKTNGNTKA
jgi:excisionase family DNA binding protein